MIPRELTVLVHPQVSTNKSTKRLDLLRLFGLFIALFSLTVFQGRAQCTPIPNAIPGLLLDFAHPTNVNNASGVAFNPNLNLYYIAQAGNSSFPLETFDALGNPLYQTNTTIDLRGLWWNDNTNQLESNGFYTDGIWSYDLDASGYALNTGTSIFPGYNMPYWHSVGDYNCIDDEIWYYYDGEISKYDRATNALLGVFPLIGIPVPLTNINEVSIFYTDCQGHEIGIYDYVLKRAYFFDKTTMTYSGMSQLPASSPYAITYRVSWANDLLWIFDSGGDIWYSYEVLSGFNNSCTNPCIPPVLVTDEIDTVDNPLVKQFFTGSVDGQFRLWVNKVISVINY